MHTGTKRNLTGQSSWNICGKSNIWLYLLSFPRSESVWALRFLPRGDSPVLFEIPWTPWCPNLGRSSSVKCSSFLSMQLCTWACICCWKGWSSGKPRGLARHLKSNITLKNITCLFLFCLSRKWLSLKLKDKSPQIPSELLVGSQKFSKRLDTQLVA